MNPWLDEIEEQLSAAPFHDWNQRINSECYAPNSRARLLNGAGRIKALINNFEFISFNIGPTLMSWIESNDPETYKRIIEADKKSAERFGGHHCAIAQPYNHMIMPLATERDKHTQIRWGLADFKHRFGRDAQGMWLPETAVDEATLRALIDNGIKFTILSQSQAKSVKERDQWVDLSQSGSTIDPSRAYEFRFDDSASIALFFYDGPISRAIAFEGLLRDGARLAQRALEGFNSARGWPEILPIATDGETFGHHQKFGEMALAAMIDRFERTKEISITNFSEYLALETPQVQARIFDNSAWSCAHGVERWRSDCGCAIDPSSSRNQKWRAPLREALDYLKSSIDQTFDEVGRSIFTDPWRARDKYIELILDRSRVDEFLEKHIPGAARSNRKIRQDALSALEMEKESMLMFASCGWFFDDISGIETIQILSHAARAIEILGEFTETSKIERACASILERAQSNYKEFRTGAHIWRERALARRLPMIEVGVNFAVAKSIGKELEDYRRAFDIHADSELTETDGDNSISMYLLEIESKLTSKRDTFSVALISMGSRDMTVLAKKVGARSDFEKERGAIQTAWRSDSLISALRLVDSIYSAANGALTYRLEDLSPNARRAAQSKLIEPHIEKIKIIYNDLFSKNRKLIASLIESSGSLPIELKVAARYVMEEELNRALGDTENHSIATDKLRALISDIERWKLKPDLSALSKKMDEALAKLLRDILTDTAKRRAEDDIEDFIAIFNFAESFAIQIDRWRLQNIYFDHKARNRDPDGELFEKLTTLLNIAPS